LYNNNYPNGNMNPQYGAQNYGPQNYGTPNPYNNPSIPPYYRPIKPWGYIGYMLLYSIPIVGFIMLIVNALAEDNINKRNFARSYLWLMLVSFIIWLVFFIIAIVIGVVAGSGNINY